MAIVNTTVPITSEINDTIIAELTSTYPFLRAETLTTTAFQRPVRALIFGTGSRKVLFTAACVTEGAKPDILYNPDKKARRATVAKAKTSARRKAN